MELNSIVNSIGLFIDIIGVILIFIYGIPNKLDAAGNEVLFALPDDQKRKKKGKTYDLLSKFGLILIIVGFIFQLISNFIN